MGGIPTAVSETMIRQHFSQWGQVGALLLCANGLLLSALMNGSVGTACTQESEDSRPAVTVLTAR